MQVPVTEAKGQLTELVRRAEAGDEVILTRHGHAAVRLVPVSAGHNERAKLPASGATTDFGTGMAQARLSAHAHQRLPIDAARLAALTATLPPSTDLAADLVRAMRDEDRY